MRQHSPVFSLSSDSRTAWLLFHTTLFFKKKNPPARCRCGRRTQSYANYAEITTQQVDLDILVDFDNHKLHGNTTLTMKTQTKLDTVYLDIWDIAVEKVYYDDKEIPSSQIKVVNKPMGQQLSVQLSTKQIARDVTVRVKIQYSTTNYDTDQNRALTFLAKEQTHSKTQPMFFTSCSPNYCRQISPLQVLAPVTRTRG